MPCDFADQTAVLYAAILEHSGHAIIATDPVGVVTVFNRRAEDMLGYAAGEVVGKRTPALFHSPDEVAARAREFSQALGEEIAPGFDVFVARTRRGLANEYEWTYVRRDGSTLDVLLSVTALRQTGGAIVGYLGMAVDISEKKAQQRQFAAREAQYRQLFDDNPAPMLVYDVDSLEILASNAAAIALYGYAGPQGLVGQSLIDLTDPEDVPDLLALLERIRRQPPAQLHRRWRHRRCDGQQIVVETHSSHQPLGGRHARLVTLKEVTAQVRAEQLAADQARFLQTLLDAMPVPLFYKDAQGRYLGANQPFFTLLGVQAADYIGKTVFEIAPPELAARYKAADDALFADPGPGQVYEAQLRSATLGLRDVLFRKAVFYDHAGRVGGLIGTVIDLTEQRRAERALRESENRLAQVLRDSPQPIFVLDGEHRVVLWNAACERVLGVPAGAVLGVPEAWRGFYPAPRPVMADLIIDGADDGAIQALYGSAGRRSPYNAEVLESEGYFPTMKPAGRWLYFSASPLRDAEGQVVGAIETLIDITERKAAEARARELFEELERRVAERTRELAQANEELRRAMAQLVQTEKMAALGTLVAGVAHELNTPLGNMLTVATTFTEQIREISAQVDGPGLRRSMLESFLRSSREAGEIIVRNAGRAAGLIANLKQVAVDQASERRRRFDLAVVVAETCATVGPRLRRSPHRLVQAVPAGIVMESYPGPLEQVLLNFLGNSLLHAFPEGAAGEIRITARVDGNQVVIDYRDDGIGMDDKVASHAFEPFFTTRLGSGGTGLGLYIVYNLVTAMLGGEVSLHSAPGQGTHFELRLPVEAPLRE